MLGCATTLALANSLAPEDPWRDIFLFGPTRSADRGSRTGEGSAFHVAMSPTGPSRQTRVTTGLCADRGLRLSSLVALTHALPASHHSRSGFTSPCTTLQREIHDFMSRPRQNHGIEGWLSW